MDPTKCYPLFVLILHIVVNLVEILGIHVSETSGTFVMSSMSIKQIIP